MRRVLLAALAACLVAAAPAGASGITTHAFMAEAAIPYVEDLRLRALLQAQADAVIAGAHYPDGGYGSSSFPGGDYGEVSHWENFVNAYVARIRSRGDCGDLRSPTGPCAGLVAHAMGIAGHGVGDEMWDWLFEPRMKDYGESPVHPIYRSGLPGMAELAGLPPGSYANTPEFAMDNVALVEYDRFRRPPVFPPPFDDLLAAYRAVGRQDITREGIAAGHSLITAAAAAERAATPEEYPRVKLTMPRSASEYLTGAGGVLDVARAAAGYYEALWHKLTTGEHPRPRVVATYPEHGQTGTATRFAGVSTSPGPGGGGAESRIIAVLSNSLLPGSVGPGVLTVRDEAGREVEPAPGFPRSGPYHDGDGTHSMLFVPAADLRPCTAYTATVTAKVRDHAGATLRRPFSWSFTTRAADGGSCAGAAGDARQQVAGVADGHAHAHVLPAGSLLALRGAALRDGVARVRVSCLGPGACTGRLTGVLRTADGSTAGLRPARFAVPRLSTQVVSLAVPRGARRLAASELEVATAGGAAGRRVFGVR